MVFPSPAVILSEPAAAGESKNPFCDKTIQEIENPECRDAACRDYASPTSATTSSAAASSCMKASTSCGLVESHTGAND